MNNRNLEYEPLLAISPLDGRYAGKLSELAPIVSEFGLIRYRVNAETTWLQALCAHQEIPEARRLTPEETRRLEDIAKNFSLDDARRVKEIERTTNHDVKAVEYFLKEKIEGTSLAPLREFVHFACTSEDISNIAHALMIRSALEVLSAVQQDFLRTLRDFCARHKSVSMLSHTHGQSASPTTVGKEMAVFSERIARQAEGLREIRLRAKMNGAVGNYNAHVAAYPDVNWPEFTRHVIEDRLSLNVTSLTTQVEPHDYMAELFDALTRMNTVLLDFNRDMWSYISMGYFVQKPVAGEVGSSTMRHKVNPIDFENSEGNLGIANAILGHMARKLPVSRMQRDLSDSTVLRNIGTAFGYTLLGWKSACKGLAKVRINPLTLERELQNSWEVMAEAIQTIMRKAGLPDPYERLKEMTRGRTMSETNIRDFVMSLDIGEADKRRLLAMTPSSYVGIAAQLTERELDPKAGEGTTRHRP